MMKILCEETEWLWNTYSFRFFDELYHP
jgi:hypothetical protein